MSAELLMLLGGASAFGLTLYWVRRRELSERYALSWLLLSFGLFMCGLFPQLIHYLAMTARLSYPATVLYLALVVIYLFAFQVSVALTHLHRRSNRLLQQIAILECEVRELQVALKQKPAESSAEVSS